MRKKNEHCLVKLKSGGYELLCENCGKTEFIQPPMPLKVFTTWLKEFGKFHRLCQPEKEKQNEKLP